MILGVMAGIAWMVFNAFIVRQPIFAKHWFWLFAGNAMVGAVMLCFRLGQRTRQTADAENAAKDEEASENGFSLSFCVFVSLAASLLVLTNRVPGKAAEQRGTNLSATGAAAIREPIAEVRKEPRPPPAALPGEARAAAAGDLSEARSFPKLKLQGITFNPPNSSVILNRETCRLGDVVEGAEVVEITRNSVTLRCQSESRTLTL